MRFVVDKKPSKPEECFLSEKLIKFGWVCSLYGLNPDGRRTKCICKPEYCNRLVELEDVVNAREV